MFSKLLPHWPDEYFLRETLWNTEFTPDIAALELSQFQLLFVCDDMKHDWDGYSFIKEVSAKAANRAFTQMNYKFYQRRVELPGGKVETTYIPLRSDRTEFELTPVIPYVASCKISGELHVVESSHFMKLDRLRQNGVQFRRERVKLLVPYREMPREDYRDVRGKTLPPALQGKKGALSPERIHIVEAWMYVGIPEYWNDLLDGGFMFSPVWVSTAFVERRWLRQYYNLVHPYEKPRKPNR